VSDPELVRIADRRLQLGVREHASQFIEQGWAGGDLEAAGEGSVEHGSGWCSPISLLTRCCW
jgi:hypothetical protein